MFSHYQAVGKKVDTFIEINDGFPQQFKSIKAISVIARRQFKMCHSYFKAIHGKSKSDGLDSVIKLFVRQGVTSEVDHLFSLDQMNCVF